MPKSEITIRPESPFYLLTAAISVIFLQTVMIINPEFKVHIRMILNSLCKCYPDFIQVKMMIKEEIFDLGGLFLLLRSPAR